MKTDDGTPNAALWIPVVLAMLAVSGCAAPEPAPLPSWNEGPTKDRIIDFVRRVTDASGPEFVPEEERIAVFDNDGTLWSERPTYFQLLFAIDRVEALDAENPAWRSEQPFKAALEGDMDALAAQGEEGLVRLVMATHAGTTTDEFARIVEDWLRTAQHARFGRPYTDCVYEPMLELLEYLRANGFKCFIVSGGGIEFLRTWSDRVYDIPPEQVIGSSVKTVFDLGNGEALMRRLGEIDFINDKAGKPVGIHRHIGRRPILAFGNSDGDLQMLQWTDAGPGPRLMALVHHTDGEREWAYDRDTHVGRLDAALDEANANDWLVVDMKRDWSRVYGFE
jgi:phosphoglycolate phosphatase-like HAD superfamily hydrolase